MEEQDAAIPTDEGLDCKSRPIDRPDPPYILQIDFHGWYRVRHVSRKRHED